MASTSKVVVLDVVALSNSLITQQDTPFIYDRWQLGHKNITETFPALTCVSQATFLTGKPPCEHGITANGFYDKTTKEVRNWHQSRALIQSERIYDTIKANNPNAVTFSNCAWHSMYDDAIDVMITPRPQYLKDGRKFPDVYTNPPYLRDELQNELGKFPLHNFWGPMSNINSSRWIANASKKVEVKFNPDFSFIYLPHLDYVLQKNGPENTKEVNSELRLIDEVVKDLVTFYESKGAEVVILSEYGITSVDSPIHINRILNKSGYINVRRERNGCTLDYGASKAFAIADHQIAMIHVADHRSIPTIKALLRNVPEIEFVFDHGDAPEWVQQTFHKDRCGDLICIAKSNAWFTYYFWLEDSDAPDYAPTIAIHEKPGFDPCELLVSYPSYLGEWSGYANLFFKAVMSQVCRFRVLVNATPYTEEAAKSIGGSHGRLDNEASAVIISSKLNGSTSSPSIKAKEVYGILIDHVFQGKDKTTEAIEG